MPTKCCWVIHGSLTSERKASTSPSSFINHSTLLLPSAKLLVFTCMHFEVRALDRLRVRTRRRVGRRGNHMHDHSRFQRDINDVTGVSLSLSFSQKSLTHNIGSASALPIIKSLFTVENYLLLSIFKRTGFPWFDPLRVILGDRYVKPPGILCVSDFSWVEEK